MKSKYSRDDYLYCADHTAKLVQEQWVDTVNQDSKWVEAEEDGDPNKVQVVCFYPRIEPFKTLEWKAPKTQLKPSRIEQPKLELKELPRVPQIRLPPGKKPTHISHLLWYFQILIASEDQEKTTFTAHMAPSHTNGCHSDYATCQQLSSTTESYEGVSSEMRRYKSFNNVTAAHQEGIMVLPQPQGKSSKSGSTGQISFAMHVDWSELAMPVNELATSPQGMKHLKSISKSVKYSMSGE
ncbi:hypothetical protein Tco_1189030 [Tanacetum coccineum]